MSLVYLARASLYFAGQRRQKLFFFLEFLPHLIGLQEKKLASQLALEIAETEKRIASSGEDSNDDKEHKEREKEKERKHSNKLAPAGEEEKKLPALLPKRRSSMSFRSNTVKKAKPVDYSKAKSQVTCKAP